jgi:hypothetical protein
MVRGAGGAHRRWALVASAAAGLLLCWPLHALAADQVALVIETLRRSRSLKLRIHAASVLARMKDRRVLPELGRAGVGDRASAVRVYALKLLARVPEGERDQATARALLRQAARDRRADVRAQASRSLAELERRAAPAAAEAPRAQAGPLVIAVGAIADRTGQARPQLRTLMRSLLIAHLRRERDLVVRESLAAPGPPGAAGPSYVVDGTIARMEQRHVGREVETACAVQLVISRPPRGILLVASGEASVLKPRAQLRPAMRESIEREALGHAVASAHENLSRFLATARTSPR